MKTLRFILAFGAPATLNGFCADTNSANTNAPATRPMRFRMRPPFCPATGWRSIRLFTPASGIIVATVTRPFLSSATARWRGRIQFRSMSLTAPMSRFRNLATPRCFPTATSFSAAKSARAKSRRTKNHLEHGRAGKTEIHSIQPIGLDHVLVTQNGNPAKLMLINTDTGKTEKEFTFPVLNPGANPHIQFRRVHETKDGTFLAAHLRDNKVVEYDADFKEIWSYATPQPWSAARLKNGNTLITAGPHTVLEVNKQGETVWQFSQRTRRNINSSFFRRRAVSPTATP
jgi:hypothetical protein